MPWLRTATPGLPRPGICGGSVWLCPPPPPSAQIGRRDWLTNTLCARERCAASFAKTWISSRPWVQLPPGEVQGRVRQGALLPGLLGLPPGARLPGWRRRRRQRERGTRRLEPVTSYAQPSRCGHAHKRRPEQGRSGDGDASPERPLRCSVNATPDVAHRPGERTWRGSGARPRRGPHGDGPYGRARATRRVCRWRVRLRAFRVHRPHVGWRGRGRRRAPTPGTCRPTSCESSTARFRLGRSGWGGEGVRSGLRMQRRAAWLR